MRFCYQGKAKNRDLPSRPECDLLWHNKVLAKMSHVSLTKLIIAYAQNYYIKDKKNLTERVGNYEACFSNYFPIPHPFIN